MNSGATTYNDIMRKFNLTINTLMRPIKRKKIIQNVLIKTKENRQHKYSYSYDEYDEFI